MSLAESSYKQRDQVHSRSLADIYVDHFSRGTPEIGDEAEWSLYQELLPQITLEDFSEIAAFLASPENTGLLIVRPEETEGSNDEQLHATALSLLENANSLAVEPYADETGDIPLLADIPTPGSITAEEHIEAVDARKWTLSNGITVIAKQTDFKDDEVILQAFSPGGHSLVPDEDHASARFAADLVSGSGVGPHDNVALQKLLAGQLVSVTPYIGELFEGFNGSASPDDLETLFQLIWLYATEPRLDESVYTRFLSRLQSVAEFYAAEPDSILYDRVNTILNQGHLRERPLSEELIQELDMARAKAVYDDRFADLGDATFVFVGAFDWDNLRSLSETYLASLPTTGRVEQWADHDIDPPTDLIDEVVRAGAEPRSNTIVVFTGDIEWNSDEALALTAAGEVLDIMLRERVREQLGGTYGVGVNARSTRLPDQEYLVSVIFGSDPNRTDELFQEILAEIELLRAGGEQEYLNRVKEQMRSAREEQLRQNNFWLGQLRSAVQNGDSFADPAGLYARLDALTLEQVVDAAVRYITPDRYIRVVLFPVEDESATDSG